MEKKTNFLYIFSTFTWMITQLVYPPKLCIAIDFNYPLALQWSQKKSKTIHMQNLGAEIKSIMIYVKMVNLNSPLL